LLASHSADGSEVELPLVLAEDSVFAFAGFRLEAMARRADC
jgi:hypothetical protein